MPRRAWWAAYGENYIHLDEIDLLVEGHSRGCRPTLSLDSRTARNLVLEAFGNLGDQHLDRSRDQVAGAGHKRHILGEIDAAGVAHFEPGSLSFEHTSARTDARSFTISATAAPPDLPCSAHDQHHG